MPKYVFEASLYLPEDDALTKTEGELLTDRLTFALAEMARRLGHAEVEASPGDPFEHVAGPDGDPIHLVKSVSQR